MHTETTRHAGLAAHTEAVERAEWTELLEDHFGIPSETFDPYLFVRVNTKNIHIVPREMAPPLSPSPDVLGMHLLRTNMLYPKITTAAAMTFGPLATRNIVELGQDGADAFLSRSTYSVTAEQTSACTGRGYVLPKHEELVLGVGFFAPNEDSKPAELRSMFPKAWSVDDEMSVFTE
ncbi:MAG: hypothetical protein ACQEVA_05290 [Myxococcota bacterium]